MVLWAVLWSLVLVTICVCNVVFPRKMWGLFKSWRFKNPDVVEPSDLVIWWYRLSGVFGVILIVSVSVNAWMDFRGHARCEEALPELKRLYETGGVPAVERRAHDLGLDVKDRTYGSPLRLGTIVLTEDGEPFATISAATPDAFCNT